MTKPTTITVGVLALQGGVIEHLNLLRKAAAHIQSSPPESPADSFQFTFTEVRTAPQLAQCDAIIIPGGESTTMAIVARRLGLLDPLREFVKSVPTFFPMMANILTGKRIECNTNPSGAPAPAWSCWRRRRPPRSRAGRS